MKKLVSLMLAVAMLLCVAGTAMAYSPEEPITILFWHTRGSGANAETCDKQIAMFNETVGKEKGIVVEGVYIGNYPTIYSKLQLSYQSGEQPAVCVVGNTYVPMLLEDGLLADMAPYAAKTGWDVSNLLDCFMVIAGNTDGQLHSLPYIRSTPLFYYNKTLADSKNLTAPNTIEEMVEFCKAMFAKDENGDVATWGLEIFNDYGYYNAAFLWQMNEPMLSEDGSSPAIYGKSMLTDLTNWKSWVDEGWCRPFDSTNASATAYEMLYQGKLAAVMASTGSMSNLTANMASAGLELGVAMFPTYDINNRAAEIGGGQIILVDAGNSEDIKAAGWEFLEFLMSDEQQFINSSGSGYLPITKSVAEYQPMVDFWAANPNYKVAYDQLSFAVCQEYPYNADLQEIITNIQEAVSLMIQEGSLTPEAAVQQIKDNCAHLF